jgi:hypothetical protein
VVGQGTQVVVDGRLAPTHLLGDLRHARRAEIDDGLGDLDRRLDLFDGISRFLFHSFTKTGWKGLIVWHTGT